jgi:hypothetical protein
MAHLHQYTRSRTVCAYVCPTAMWTRRRPDDGDDRLAAERDRERGANARRDVDRTRDAPGLKK